MLQSTIIDSANSFLTVLNRNMMFILLSAHTINMSFFEVGYEGALQKKLAILGEFCFL